MELKTRSLGLTSIDEAARTCDFVASTDSVDSYGEVVTQDWDLSRYRANPVCLLAHDARDLPIGVATRCEVVNGALECTIKFATADANPKAEQVWRLIKAKMLRALSVGFVPGSVRTERRGDREVTVLGAPRLYEVSVVAIGANADALAKSLGVTATSAPQLTEADRSVAFFRRLSVEPDEDPDARTERELRAMFRSPTSPPKREAPPMTDTTGRIWGRL